eukprot:TRINITY_DN16857_c0_g1_i2.p2 TRINITY_DN16857_c0_g1~~TRINITY_DN16857_c0_g1_i2.p2  ORF type:complete len:233 (+),score=31.36 TRINITY_DN16857_c0_g1_i2:637-1335(+)
MRAAKAHHPDMNPGDASAQQRFQRVSQAYEILRDPGRRAQYDSTGQWAGAGRTDGASARQQAEETFRNAARDREVIAELVWLYMDTVREEAVHATDHVRAGRWPEAWELVREHRGLFALLAGLALVLRFPALIGAGLRVGVAVLMHPAVFRTIMRTGLDHRVWSWAWMRLVAAAHRQRARLRQRAATREQQQHHHQRRHESSQAKSGSTTTQETASQRQSRGGGSGARVRRD